MLLNQPFLIRKFQAILKLNQKAICTDEAKKWAVPKQVQLDATSFLSGIFTLKRVTLSWIKLRRAVKTHICLEIIGKKFLGIRPTYFQINSCIIKHN